MKKVMSILLIAVMILGSSMTVLAADNSLDIEKAAIGTIKNSQDLQNLDRWVDKFNKYCEDAKAGANKLRNLLPLADYIPGMNTYKTVETIVLLPMETENQRSQFLNKQQVATNGVRLSAYTDYKDLLKAKSAMDIQQKLMLDLEADYQKAQQQETLGVITSAELRLSEITYLKAQKSYQGARQTFDSALMKMNKDMGEDISKKYGTFQDDNIVPAEQIEPLNEYVNMALGSRAEIVDAQATLDLKKKEYEYHIAEIPTDFEFYKQKQEYMIASAENDLELAKIKVQEDITNSYKTLELAMKQWEAMGILEEKADINIKIAQSQYDNGVISLQALGDAKVAKAQADVNYKNAQLDAWLAQRMMESASGFGYIPSSSSNNVDFSISPYPSKNKPNPREENDD